MFFDTCGNRRLYLNCFSCRCQQSSVHDNCHVLVPHIFKGHDQSISHRLVFRRYRKKP